MVGLALIIERNDDDLLGTTGKSADYILGTAIGELIAALLLFVVAAAVMNGSRWSRFLVGLVVGIRIALAVYWMIAHTGGGLQWNAIVTTLFGIVILWALYGNDDAETYFER